jgi:hypothetical protein
MTRQTKQRSVNITPANKLNMDITYRKINFRSSSQTKYLILKFLHVPLNTAKVIGAGVGIIRLYFTFIVV